jgi:prepilin-type N-terminal cleavage/methylation domain-containing protein
MTTPRRCGGFTLVELLTVVAILALLAAIATAAFLRVRGSETERASNATLQKLKAGLDKRWKAILDDAAEDSNKGRIPVDVLTFAGGDKDRARVIWTYYKLKNEFPTTIAEACNPVRVPDLTNLAGPGIVVLQPKAVFVEGFRKQIQPPVTVAPNLQGIGSAQWKVESAACFYWALSATAVRGETFDADGTTQQAGLAEPLKVAYTGSPSAPNEPTITPQVFKDAWGNPVAFLRQGYTAELNGPPYARTGAGTNRDPIDPTARLLTPSGTWTSANIATLVDQFWIKLNLTPHATLDGTPFLTLRPIYPRDAVPPASPSGAWNWTPTLVSAGADHKDAGFSPDLGQGDDLLSFRLGREGKGN